MSDRPRRERRPQEKVARLIASATAVFGRDGYARTKVQAVCKAADVSVGTFYDHFENKADLMLHVAELSHESFGTPQARSLSELELEVRRILSSPLAGVARAWLEAIAVEPELRSAHVRMRETHVRRFAEWVRQARAGRSPPPPIGDETTGRAVIAMLKEATVATYEPEAERAAAAARAIWFLVHGE